MQSSLRYNGRSFAIPDRCDKIEPEDRSPRASFEWIAPKLLVPCVPIDPSGAYRVPDGVRFLSMEQAAERYGISEEFLILAYKRYLDEVGFVSLATTFREVMFDDEGRPQWGQRGEPLPTRKRAKEQLQRPDGSWIYAKEKQRHLGQQKKLERHGAFKPGKIGRK